MIDLARLRENPQEVQDLIARKEPDFNVQQLLSLDSKLRSMRQDVEALRKEKNELASKGAGGITPEVREKSIQLGKNLKVKEEELSKSEKELNDLWLACPNVPQADLPIGNKEANKPVKVVGNKPEFGFALKNHVELNQHNRWFDMETAAGMSEIGRAHV